MDVLLEKLECGEGIMLDMATMVAVTLSYERDVTGKLIRILNWVKENLSTGKLLNRDGLLHCKMTLCGTNELTWQVHGMATVMFLGWRLCCL